MNPAPRLVFFGSSDIAVASLEHLATAGCAPTLIITAPDKPQGRHLELVPSEVGIWADTHNIPTLRPDTLKGEEIVERLRAENADLFVVVAYGKIIPQVVLDLPRLGTINMHPSLLPRHRGPCPIESQILTEERGEDVGVSIMLLDADIDHGPVLAQRDRLAELEGRWPIKASELRPLLARHGGELLAAVVGDIKAYLAKAHEQDHSQATFCTKMTKDDALIDLSDDPETNYRKILAYDVWPRAYFFAERHGRTDRGPSPAKRSDRQVRVIVTEATLDKGALIIKKVIPEGKREMAYEDFVRGN